jgi:hypothetical protein
MNKLLELRYLASFSAFFVAAHGWAMAEPTLDQLLATVSVAGSSACAHVELKLNRPVNVTDVFPAEKGMDLSVHIEHLATTLTYTGRNLKEAASVPPQNPAGLGGAIYDPTGTSGPEIHFVFAKAMAYKLKRDDDNRHIVLDVAPAEASEKCLGFKAADSTETTKGDLTSKTDASPASGDQTPAQQAEAALSDGKKQLASGDFNRATAFFTKAVSLGSGRVKQDAQEMLGLAHERANQMAFAKAEYETYLKLYPTGADAARVKQRLAGVVATMENQANQQFALHQAKSGSQTVNSGKGDLQGLPLMPGQSGTTGQGTGVSVSNLGLHSNLIEERKDPNAWTWQKNGSVAQYFYRDDNFVAATIGGPLFGTHQIFQNEAISTVDGFIHGENQDYALEARVSSYNEQGFGEQANIANSSFSTVYIDGKLKGPKLEARIGRQSQSTGGVFGRFDGGVLSWEAIKNVKLGVLGGSPIFSRNAMPFADNHFFYGVGAEYNSDKKDWSAAFYAIEQNVGDLVDRRAVGGEAHYNGQTLVAYSAADYDIFFHELNNAYVTGTWLPRQGTSIYGTLDYRRVPFLLTSNALMGQNFGALQTLVDAVGLDNVNEWAGDRTAWSETASAGISQQLNDQWQASVDAMLGYYSGTPASGGVEATPDPGFDLYASVTMSGSSILRQNDTLTGSLRYAWSSSATTYMADAFYRLPINDKLRIGPRFRVSLRNSSISDQVQYLALPSLSASYRINNNWSVESELGLRYQDTVTNGQSSPSLDVLATAGYRYEFQ